MSLTGDTVTSLGNSKVSLLAYLGGMPQGPHHVLVVGQGVLLLPSSYNPAWLVNYVIPDSLIVSSSRTLWILNPSSLLSSVPFAERIYQPEEEAGTA